MVRYSKSITMIKNVFKKQKESLLVVCGMAVGYILVSALVVISIEPETFPTFFDAVYWATVSLTTVGYGDIYATSIAGKIITMFSSVFGIAIVALPAGIVTAGYMDELNNSKKNKDDTGNSTRLRMRIRCFFDRECSFAIEVLKQKSGNKKGGQRCCV